MPIAVKSGGELVIEISNGTPAPAVVPVGIAGVSLAVAFGIKIQVGGQFVAGAASGRAAHIGKGIGES